MPMRRYLWRTISSIPLPPRRRQLREAVDEEQYVTEAREESRRRFDHVYEAFRREIGEFEQLMTEHARNDRGTQ